MCRGLKELLLLPNVLLSLTTLLLSLVLLPTLPALLLPVPVCGCLGLSVSQGDSVDKQLLFRFHLLITCRSFALGLRLQAMEPGRDDGWRYVLSSLASGTTVLEPNMCTSILIFLLS